MKMITRPQRVEQQKTNLIWAGFAEISHPRTTRAANLLGWPKQRRVRGPIMTPAIIVSRDGHGG